MRAFSLLASASAAGLLAVRAEHDPSDADLAAGINKFKADQKKVTDGLTASLDAVEAGMNEMAVRFAAMGLNGFGGGSAPEDPEYTKQFTAYFRDGGNESEVKEANRHGDRGAIRASMTNGDRQSGGYLAPVEWDRQVHKAQRAISPLRRLARVVSTTGAGYVTLWNDDQWGSGWVGETAARPATSTPNLFPIEFKPGQIYAMPVASQDMLDDAAFPLEDWIAGEVATVFDRQEGIAFLSGDGINKPFGLLQYVPGGAAATQHPGGTLDVVASGHATTIPNADVLMDFKYGLAAPYRQNASWLMNSQTAAAIAKMKDQTGAYLWKEGLSEDQPTTLLGRRVEIDEGMPGIGAGNLAIAFGDFQMGYVINDRIGIRILRDPYTAKPFVAFYTTKRVGGGVIDPRAIRLLKIAAA